MNKMKVLTLALNNPLFIEIQNYTLKKYLMCEYEFIVFNDAKNFPDYTNDGDVTLRKQIDETCKRLNIRCISMQNDNHQHEHFIERYSGSFNQLFSFQKENPDIYLFLDRNMFLINYFSGYLEPYVISSPWPGLIYMDFTKTEIQNTVWKVIPTIDRMAFFLELVVNVSKKEITSFWNDCHINFVKDETVLCEMYDSFLRYEVGIDKEKTMKLKKELEKVTFNQDEKISILIPLYNGIEFIEESVRSILEQTYTNWELIIGINGHPPNSDVYKKAKKFESQKIKVIEYNTKGKAATVNKMIDDCYSNWIAMLDIDDIWMKEKLEFQSFYMNYDVIGTKCVYFGDIVGTVPPISEGDFSDYDFLLGNPVINSSSLVRKEIYMRYKLDETGEKSGIEDYDFWLRIRNDKNRKSRFYNLSNILVKHRIHKKSAFNNTNHEKVDDILKSYLPMIYYINLDHRTDRKDHLIDELRKIDYPKQNICRIEASPGGSIGCTLSHIKTIEKFLESNQEKCIILEDDFTFYPNTKELFYKTINSVFDWNVIMLSSNIIQSNPFSENLLKCVNAQTSSGYMLHRKFASTLLENFKESSTQLINGRPYETYALDQYWKRLQHLNWYICNPKIGYQMESFSDIEKCLRNYGV